MTTCLWFKRDLRIQDHPALARAVALGRPVLALYVVEPAYWALSDTSHRQWAVTAEALAELRDAIGALGTPLVVRVGDTVEVLRDLHARHGFTELVSHEETGNAWTFERDKTVAAWARDVGLPWTELPQSSVVRRLQSRDDWSKQRDRFVVAPTANTPPALRGVAENSGRIPSARDLGLEEDGCRLRQHGGRAAAEACLQSFLTERGLTYRKDMSTPVAGERACSRLSAHLATGAISVREVFQATAARQRHVRGTRDGWGGSLKSFQSRLAWRDHFTQKLEDEPELEWRCLHSAYEDLRPRGPDAARLSAWEAGETGIPFVDACMRYLRATGWLNFRMRSMLMAVASYHLWLDWRATGPHLARMFTDYEPGIHWPQVQMQSGTTGMNTVRIYNPVKQGHDQDPTGAFTREWVPELRDVPDPYLQEPWRWDGAAALLGHTYPAPIVDVAAAAKAARQAVWGVRRGSAFRAEADRVVERHASRKDRTGRFVNDREKMKDPGPEQLGLDL